MTGAQTNIPAARSFLPTETTKALQPSIVGPVPIKRREGVRLNLVGEINRNGPISLAAVKYLFERQPKKEVPVTLGINSNGGNFDEAFKIYEFLRAGPGPLATVADKHCHSGALIIFMAADLRIANPGAELLLHGTRIGVEDLPPCLTAQALQRRVDELNADDSRILDVLQRRTGFDRSDFEVELNTEQLMSEAFAIHSGIVHEFRGLDRPVDPTWPEAARQIQAAGMILPPRLLSPSYMNACRMAEHFPVID